ncbi:hypothetical protein PCH_Pc13g07580 [Penicillium rubens Wisconsin 54-1255]|uniref:Uncharacterized protein n=1 Tax=Penicillium rubens (strain ATCC 28089 / DSM 1075 / NRRL 1951 / Wisconsin 54-1255) TaxID=500485 RepID=B6H3R6_PENRW|nr:hypothetical protein PCH_Pc13g07580 [Penicillium rubens Wisconsin 54-1255]
MAAVSNMIVEQVGYTAEYLDAMIDGRVIFMRQPTGTGELHTRPKTTISERNAQIFQAPIYIVRVMTSSSFLPLFFLSVTTPDPSPNRLYHLSSCLEPCENSSWFPYLASLYGMCAAYAPHAVIGKACRKRMAFAFPLLSIFHRHLEKQILCSYAKGHKGPAGIEGNHYKLLSTRPYNGRTILADHYCRGACHPRSEGQGCLLHDVIAINMNMNLGAALQSQTNTTVFIGIFDKAKDESTEAPRAALCFCP